MPSIIVVDQGQKIVHEIRSGENLVGRLPESAIPIPLPSVSGRHAKIVWTGNELAIEDIGSRNGTFVNQQRISTAVPLKHNDMVQFGDAMARIDHPASVPPPPAAAPPVPAATAQPSSAATVSDFKFGTVTFDDDNEGDSNVTGQLAGSGRFGSLDANPEAKLKAVLEISNSCAGSVDVAKVLPKILDSLFTIFKYADRGCILLKDEQGQMAPRAMKHRREGEDATVRLSRTIIQKVLQERIGMMSADASSDAAFSGSQSIADLKIRSMMCVPLLGLDGEPMGVLSIDSQNPLGQFTQDDLDLLMTVAGQAALAYENARLVQVYAAKQKQDNEMQIAQQVQRALLPLKLPTAEGYEFYASYDSAQAVGGDYYDCFRLPDGRIALSFGDVAGKGVPGALIMARMSSCVQSTMRHVHDLKEAMNAINEHMCDTAVEGRFVTYVLAFVDPVQHTVELSNAGHMSPIIRRADASVEQFDEELVGPPIGVVDGYPFDSEVRALLPGDLIVLTTDGVDEAMNPQGDLYTGERVLAFVKAGPAKADELGKALLSDVRRHANGRPQNDDITIMTFGRNPSES